MKRMAFLTSLFSVLGFGQQVQIPNLDVVKNYEERFNVVFPQTVKEVVDYQLNKKANIVFELPSHGDFELLDFTKIPPVVVNGEEKIRVEREEQFSNPYYVVDEIKYCLERYYPVVDYPSVIPLARNTWGDQMLYLVVESGKGEVILIDIDNSALKPIPLGVQINELLDLNKLEERKPANCQGTDECKPATWLYYSGVKKIEEIVDSTAYFYDIPDCIFGADAYKELLRKSFNLLDKDIFFEFIDLSNKESTYRFKVVIGEFEKTYEVPISSDYVAANELIDILNDIVKNKYSKIDKNFYLISYDLCDFGIVCADSNLAKELMAQGILFVDDAKYRLTEDEKRQINEESDLKTAIDNILFYHEICMDGEEKDKKGALIYFNYDTRIILKDSDIEQIKIKTPIKRVVKIEGGYQCFFIVE